MDYELERFAERQGRQVRFSKEARQRFLPFARSPDARWTANFRDLNSAVIRKTTNDSDRLRKYLARFDLQWDDIR